MAGANTGSAGGQKNPRPPKTKSPKKVTKKNSK